MSKTLRFLAYVPPSCTAPVAGRPATHPGQTDAAAPSPMNSQLTCLAPTTLLPPQLPVPSQTVFVYETATTQSYTAFPFVCLACGPTTTTQSRRGPRGKATLCNKCGIAARRREELKADPQEREFERSVRRRMSVANLLTQTPEPAAATKMKSEAVPDML